MPLPFVILATMSFLKRSFLLLLIISSADCLASSLSRSADTPKHFYQVRSLIVCKTKCESQCNSSNSVWDRFACNKCIQECIRKENMIFEDGPKDQGLIRSIVVSCARLVTYTQISAKINVEFSTSEILQKAVAVLEYRKLSDSDDLYAPPWFVSQIVRERSITITDLECGYIYQFRLTLISSKIIDQRTSMWISNKHLCRY